MAKKHSKYRNTGLLFEFLTRKITSDVLNERQSKAQEILKKHFNPKSELFKEYKLYEIILNNKTINENKFSYILNDIISEKNKLNTTKLKQEKYNLIKDIKENLDINTLFKTKVQNYKIYSSIYQLFNTTGHDLINSKINLIEQTINVSKSNTEVGDSILESVFSKDEETKNLIMNLTFEKFNTKYKGLLHEQKEILRNFLYNISESKDFNIFFKSKVNDLLTKFSNLVIIDSALKEKINETNKILGELYDLKTVKNNHIVCLMNYVGLYNELKG